MKVINSFDGDKNDFAKDISNKFSNSERVERVNAEFFTFNSFRVERIDRNLI